MSDKAPELGGDIPENFMHVPFIAPPFHLAVTAAADIGVLVYVSGGKSSYSSLNPVYCAPNKIWEYAKFGVPMIANDNPALEYEFNTNGIGYCAKELSNAEILAALEKIDAAYDEMSAKARVFYAQYDVKAEIERLLNDAANR